MLGYTKVEFNRTIDQIAKIYPRPSPYIDSNLHKFGVGPAATMLPIQNMLPVQSKRLNLNSSQYFRKNQIQSNSCYCCLQPIDQDLINNLDEHIAQMAQQQKSIIAEQQSTQLHQLANKACQSSQNSQGPKMQQTSLIKYFAKQKRSEIVNQSIQQKSERRPICFQCNKLVCRECIRVCSRCRRFVCKFDYKEDNSLGIHNCQ